MSITKQKVEIVASAMHAAWYSFTVLALKGEGLPWKDALDYQKDSSRDGARFFLGLHASGLDSSLWPEMAHSNWLAHKAKDGWRFGETKDAEAKTHPCMVPYSSLSDADKVKDLVAVQAAVSVIEAMSH